MSELGPVLSTKVLGFCPRELLGKVCLTGSGGYECLCKDMKSSAIGVVRDDKGGAVVVLTIELDWLAGNDWQNIRRNIDLLGYRADYKTAAGGIERGISVTATLDLSRRENQELKAHALELGI